MAKGIAMAGGRRHRGRIREGGILPAAGLGVVLAALPLSFDVAPLSMVPNAAHAAVYANAGGEGLEASLSTANVQLVASPNGNGQGKGQGGGQGQGGGPGQSNGNGNGQGGQGQGANPGQSQGSGQGNGNGQGGGQGQGDGGNQSSGQGRGNGEGSGNGGGASNGNGNGNGQGSGNGGGNSGQDGQNGPPAKDTPAPDGRGSGRPDDGGSKDRGRDRSLEALGLKPGQVTEDLDPGAGSLELDDALTSALISSGWGAPPSNLDGFANHVERVRAHMEIATALGHDPAVGALQANTAAVAGLSAAEEARIVAIRAALTDGIPAEQRAALEAELSELIAAGRSLPRMQEAWWLVDLDVDNDGRVDVDDLAAVRSQSR